MLGKLSSAVDGAKGSPVCSRISVSHDRMFLRGLGSRVLELGGESGTDRNPTVYPGSYVEYVQKLGHEAPGIYS
jgi:ATPase subunit of ABC transporter with duplicated ATPase domains